MRGTGIRFYNGTGPWLAFLYGTWNAFVLGAWAFAITIGVKLALRVVS